MSHSGSGVYTYSYYVQNDGVLNISVILQNKGYIHTQYYYNYDFTGITSSFYVNYIDYNWGSDAVFSRNSQHVSVIFTSYFLPPITGTYTFYLEHDDGSDLIIGGVSNHKV